MSLSSHPSSNARLLYSSVSFRFGQVAPERRPRILIKTLCFGFLSRFRPGPNNCWPVTPDDGLLRSRNTEVKRGLPVLADDKRLNTFRQEATLPKCSNCLVLTFS